ncbi:MAG: UDP-N-acetylmuramate dehydrogenase [Actinobacteria bacterium]|nr:UDP-N-acetylmuramate dehydrogenase [Actinomycetota bacterium]MCB9411980.1 UDP-N-acetylmuramate dehydrogenase [Actinomycetota bacterium]
MSTAIRLADYTTLRLGGPCTDVVVADTQQSLVSAVISADAERTPLLILAGGSNVVIGDDGWPGRAVVVRSRGIKIRGAEVEVAAGESWPDFVAAMVAAGRRGVEALSGIPGSVGATPIQNVGAYGQEVSGCISAVRVWDREEARARVLTAAECEFSYRDSLFKRRPGRFVVLSVVFDLPEVGTSAPIRYAELADKLSLPTGAVAPVGVVAAAVLDLRRAKGMVLDPQDHDTWSAGSFFTNPLVSQAQADDLPAAAPRYPAGAGMVKVSAAWLIDQAGFGKGFARGIDAPVALSTKHTLALTNRGRASTEDLLELARTIRAGVSALFDIDLQPEPVLVNCRL